jgi:hypothetical protein
MTIFEQSNDLRNTCILSSNVINDIITQHNILNNDFGNILNDIDYGVVFRLSHWFAWKCY